MDRNKCTNVRELSLSLDLHEVNFSDLWASDTDISIWKGRRGGDGTQVL